MNKHAISISCCLKLALLALFCITKPRKTLEVDLTHVKKTGTAWLSYSLAIWSYVFQMSRPFYDVKFIINLAHGDQLVGRFYYILHSFSNKTYTYLVSALVKSISEKRAAKKRKSLAKIVFLDVGTTVRHTFPTNELRCICEKSKGSDYWQLINYWAPTRQNYARSKDRR